MIVKKNALALALLMALPGTSMALGVVGTDHDFASRQLTTAYTVDSTGTLVQSSTPQITGVCTYCHTPHSAFTTSLLWNHKLSAASFTWTDATTTSGGTTYASITPTYKGPTVKCLSCHDGTVAIGDVSMYKETANSVFNTFKIAAGIKNLGLLTSGMNGNHPVAMPYPLNNVANTYNGITTGSRVALADFKANPTRLNGTWIKLYNDTGSAITAGAGPGGTAGIECTSCHDPHNKEVVNSVMRSSPTSTADGPTLLLRASVNGSTAAQGYICEQCHSKE
jgi:hypothetical protein